MIQNSTTTEIRYVGLDVHKREITACIVDAQGKKQRTICFPLTRQRIQTFAKVTLRPTDHVALEATTNSWAVADVLRPHVARVVVSNPMATKAIAQAKVKTDKVDAAVLAHLLRCDYLPNVWQPDPHTQRMRQLTGRRAALVQQRTAIRNRIHSVLAMRLIETPNSLFSKSGMQWLEQQVQCGMLDEQARLLITSDLTLMDQLQEQIGRFDTLLAQHAWHDERVRLLMTLPCVDVTVAEALLAALGDITRFRTPQHAASYLGLVPSTRQSAAKCYHGPITKQGNVQARWMLVQAAQQLGRHPGPLGNFFRRIKRRKNHNVAVVACARKLAIIAIHMLKNNEPYRYAQPATTEAKLRTLRVRATGAKRRPGMPKGQKAQAKLPGGSRTVKSLDRVYQEESIPPRQSLPNGEKKMLEAQECSEFVRSIAADRVVPRKTRKNAKEET
jgi:transposase